MDIPLHSCASLAHTFPGMSLSSFHSLHMVVARPSALEEASAVWQQFELAGTPQHLPELSVRPLAPLAAGRVLGKHPGLSLDAVLPPQTRWTGECPLLRRQWREAFAALQLSMLPLALPTTPTPPLRNTALRAFPNLPSVNLERPTWMCRVPVGGAWVKVHVLQLVQGGAGAASSLPRTNAREPFAPKESELVHPNLPDTPLVGLFPEAPFSLSSLGVPGRCRSLADAPDKFPTVHMPASGVATLDQLGGKPLDCSFLLPRPMPHVTLLPLFGLAAAHRHTPIDVPTGRAPLGLACFPLLALCVETIQRHWRIPQLKPVSLTKANGHVDCEARAVPSLQSAARCQAVLGACIMDSAAAALGEARLPVFDDIVMDRAWRPLLPRQRQCLPLPPLQQTQVSMCKEQHPAATLGADVLASTVDVSRQMRVLRGQVSHMCRAHLETVCLASPAREELPGTFAACTIERGAGTPPPREGMKVTHVLGGEHTVETAHADATGPASVSSRAQDSSCPAPAPPVPTGTPIIVSEHTLNHLTFCTSLERHGFLLVERTLPSHVDVLLDEANGVQLVRVQDAQLDARSIIQSAERALGASGLASLWVLLLFEGSEPGDEELAAASKLGVALTAMPRSVHVRVAPSQHAAASLVQFAAAWAAQAAADVTHGAMPESDWRQR